MASCRVYITKLTSDEAVQDKLQEYHDEIFNKLVSTKLFRAWNGYQFLPNYKERPVSYAKAKNEIKKMNADQGVPVVDSAFTKATGKEFMYVNVVNLVEKAELAVKNKYQGTLFQDNKSANISKASKETLELIEEAVDRLGIKVVEITDAYGKVMNMNGFANQFEKLVGYVRDNKATVLPEEVMHIVVGLLKQKNPTLYKSFLRDITNYGIYNTVFNDYKSIYLKDGKPDVIKIKEEAVTKLLVELLIKENELANEVPENLVKMKSLWNTFTDWFTNFINKLGLPFLTRLNNLINPLGSVSVKEILNYNFDGIQIDNQEVYLQATNNISEQASKIWDTFQDRNKRIEKKLSPEDKGDKYFFNDVKMKKRVSDFTKSINPIFTQEKKDDTFSEAGTAIHKDLEDIFYRIVDKATGFVKPKDDGYANISVAFPNDMQYYEALYDYLKATLQDKILYPEGTRFMSEVMVANEDLSLGGTIDLMAILPDGQIDVLDWKSMNIDPFLQPDILESRAKKFNIQITKYVNDVLKKKYGVTKTRHTRAIPIRTSFSKKDGKLIAIEIGNVDPKKESRAYLLPIPTLLERTENEKLNKVLDKLVALYNSISNRPAPNKNKDAKKEQLNAIFKAIRFIQTKEDVGPLVEQLEVLAKNANFISESITDIINRDVTLSDEDINRQSENILKIKDELSVMRELDLYLHDLYPQETDEQKEFVQKLNNNVKEVRLAYDKIQTTINNWGQNYIAKKYGVRDLLNPEVAMSTGSFSVSNFRTLDKLPTSAAEILNKIIQNTVATVEYELQAESKIYQKIFDDLKAWQGSKKASSYLDLIMKQEDGKRVNKLIDQYDWREYQKQLQEAIDKKDVAWIKTNVDLKALKKEQDEIRENKLSWINSYTFNSDADQNKIIQQEKIDEIIRVTDLANPSMWTRFDTLKKHPSVKWETKEYKALQKEAPVFALYNFIRKWNDNAAKEGYINAYDKRNFLPFIRKTLIDKVAYGGSFNFIKSTIESMTINSQSIGYGAYDDVTGELQNRIPKYFTSEIDDFSEDILSNMGIFINQVINYKHKSKVEDNVKLLLDIERNKKSLQTIDGIVTGEPISGNDINSKVLENYIKSYFYDQKYVDSGNGNYGNLTLGKGWNNIAKAVNKRVNANLLPTVEESMEGRKISFLKIIDNNNRWFRLKTLGLKIPTSIATYLGASAQATINAGTWYTRNQFWNAQMQQFGTRIFKNNKFHLELIEKFLPVDDKLMHEIKRIAGSKVKQIDLAKGLMSLMREADNAVSYANFLAFMANTIVIDGEIVNARAYYRNSDTYKNRYNLPEEQRKDLERGFEDEVKKLIDQNSIDKVDLSSLSEETVNKYKLLIRNVSKRNTGSMTAADKMGVNMTVLGNSFMVFKSWIPDQLDQRFGELLYNSSADAFEYGRMRSFAKVIVQDYTKSITNLIAVYKGSDKGIALLDKMYQEKVEQYKAKTGKDLTEKLSKEEFYDLMRKNMNAAIKEMQILAALLALFISAKMMPPDDKEDEELKNFYRYTIRILDKLQGEVSFFYNPLEFQNFVNQNLFPSLGVLMDAQKVMANFMQEVFGTVFKNNEWVESAHPVKYLMKFFPVSNSATELIPVFAPEWAKEAGIQLKENVAR